MNETKSKFYSSIPFFASLLLAFVGVVLLFAHGLDAEHNVPFWTGVFVLSCVHPLLVALSFFFKKIPGDETLSDKQSKILSYLSVGLLLLCLALCLIGEFAKGAIQNPSTFTAIVSALVGIPSFALHLFFRFQKAVRSEIPTYRKVLFGAFALLSIGLLAFGLIASLTIGNQFGLCFLVIPLVTFLDIARKSE